MEQVDLDYSYQGEWFDKHIQTLMDYGLAVGGYDNDLQVDEVASLDSFMTILDGVIERVDPAIAKVYSGKVAEIQSEMTGDKGELLHKEDVVTIIGEMLFEENTNVTWQTLINQRVINRELTSKLLESEHKSHIKNCMGWVLR